MPRKKKTYGPGLHRVMLSLDANTCRKLDDLSVEIVADMPLDANKRAYSPTRTRALTHIITEFFAKRDTEAAKP
jgi:hypothetical protein